MVSHLGGDSILFSGEPRRRLSVNGSRLWAPVQFFARYQARLFTVLVSYPVKQRVPIEIGEDQDQSTAHGDNSNGHVFLFTKLCPLHSEQISSREPTDGRHYEKRR